MEFEKIRLKTTVKSGKKVWTKGMIVNYPVPGVLRQEIIAKTGTVEVLEVRKPGLSLDLKKAKSPSTMTTAGKSGTALMRPDELPEVPEPPVVKPDNKKASSKGAVKKAFKKVARKKRLIKKPG